MKLEVGKRYIDGAGRECVVILDDGDVGRERFSVHHEGHGDIWHYEDGRSNLGDREDLRLISEVADTVSKFKVGDKVRIIGPIRSARCAIGEVGVISGVTEGIIFGDKFYAKYIGTIYKINNWYYGDDAIVPHADTPTLQLNQTYTSKNGDKWECIAIKGDVAWLAGVHGDRLGAGYKFKLDGTPICLFSSESPYRIVFEPVVETRETTVTIEGRPVRLEYTKTDGVFDYASVTPVVPL